MITFAGPPQLDRVLVTQGPRGFQWACIIFVQIACAPGDRRTCKANRMAEQLTSAQKNALAAAPAGTGWAMVVAGGAGLGADDRPHIEAADGFALAAARAALAAGAAALSDLAAGLQVPALWHLGLRVLAANRTGEVSAFAPFGYATLLGRAAGLAGRGLPPDAAAFIVAAAPTALTGEAA
jgi:hypothetical protein